MRTSLTEHKQHMQVQLKNADQRLTQLEERHHPFDSDDEEEKEQERIPPVREPEQEPEQAQWAL